MFVTKISDFNKYKNHHDYNQRAYHNYFLFIYTISLQLHLQQTPLILDHLSILLLQSPKLRQLIKHIRHIWRCQSHKHRHYHRHHRHQQPWRVSPHLRIPGRLSPSNHHIIKRTTLQNLTGFSGVSGQFSGHFR